MKKLNSRWLSRDLENSDEWIFHLDQKSASCVTEWVKDHLETEKPLFEFQKDDFQIKPVLQVISCAVEQAMWGSGIALIKGFPRQTLTESEFRMMIWSIGLQFGVPRPQGKLTQYLSEVSNQGTNYRKADGRGYSSNSKLDFHTDSCDLALLACFNQAKSGGQSLVSSSHSIWEMLKKESMDLVEVASKPFYFSRNQEQAPDEPLYYSQPLFDHSEEGKLFGKANRNRVQTAQGLYGVPPISIQQKECLDHLDHLLRRPDVMYQMYLEPGDIQLINNHCVLHSRTEFQDFEQKEERRLLYRLWLSPPDAPLLPKSWKANFGSIQPRTVRGGIKGHNHDSNCIEFEQRQASDLGMNLV